MEKGDKKLLVFARATEEAHGFINLMETYLGETPYGFASQVMMEHSCM
jgi:hypothetical protein